MCLLFVSVIISHSHFLSLHFIAFSIKVFLIAILRPFYYYNCNSFFAGCSSIFAFFTLAFFRSWFELFQTIRQCHSLSSQCCTNTLSFFPSSFHLLLGRLFCVFCLTSRTKIVMIITVFSSTFYYIKFDPAVIISFVLFHSYVVLSVWASIYDTFQKLGA